MIDAGELDARRRSASGRAGPSGRRGGPRCATRSGVSVRDLMYLMLAVSDNAACDALYDRIGGRR